MQSFCPEMGKKNTLKIEIRKNVHILRTRSKGRCRCVAECEKLLCHSVTKTLGAIVLFYTFSISLTFYNQRFIHVRNGDFTVLFLSCYLLLLTGVMHTAGLCIKNGNDVHGGREQIRKFLYTRPRMIALVFHQLKSKMYIPR